MLPYPERKRYQDDINDVFIVEYEQASMEETQDYMILAADETKALQLMEYVYSWVRRNVKIKRLKSLRNDKETLKELYNKREQSTVEIWKSIETKLHVMVDSIYKDRTIPKTKDPRPVFLDSRLSYIADDSKIPLDQITKRITYEQFQWYCDKMTFEYLESFPEGKMLNNQIKWAKGLTPEQIQIRDLLLAHRSDT